MSLIVTEGAVNDSQTLINTYNNMYIDPQTTKYKNSNKHKQHFLADKGYDTNEIRTFLGNKGYDVIIPYNKRNTKDLNKIKQLKIKQKHIYRNRMVIENYYSWIKQFPKLMFVFEKSMNNYQQILYLATSILIFNRFLV